jgi:hypothetical protein
MTKKNKEHPMAISAKSKKKTSSGVSQPHDKLVRKLLASPAIVKDNYL